MQEIPVLQALLQFVRFGLPCDFGRTITIARGGWADAYLSFPSQAGIQRPIDSTTAVPAYWIDRSEPGDDTSNEKRRANSVQWRRSPRLPQGQHGQAARPRRDQICNVG